MHRHSGQRGLADALVSGQGRESRLQGIDALMDWKAVAAIYSAPSGRPSFPPLVIIKAAMLGQWYHRSDPELEEALADRLSFRRFCGFSLDEQTPDPVTIWRFRKELSKRQLAEALLTEVNRQLDRRGLVVKRGTLLDATRVKAQARPPKRGAVRSEVDPDANWTRQGGPYPSGYKAHVAVDQHSGLVRRAVLTPAKVYESQVADRLISGDERAVYADKASEHKQRRLKVEGIEDRIMHRSHKNQLALPHRQQRRSALIAPIRRQVERVFGTLKRSYGYTRVRYCSLVANEMHLHCWPPRSTSGGPRCLPPSA